MKFILILIYFLREEIKLNFRRLKITYVFIKDFSIFRYFLYLFNNSSIPCRDELFRNYLHENSQKWKNKSNSRSVNNKNILITNMLNHAGYTSAEILIGKNLMEIFNASGIGLLNEYNLKKILLYKSYGIDKIIILKKLNIFTRLMYFIKAYLIIRSYNNMDEFLKFNINNVDIGKAVYDHYIRFSGVGTTNEFKREFYVNLSKCLLIYHQINKYLKKFNIIASVQSEKQFIPGAIIFQSALVNGIDTYSRLGPNNAFTVKRYRDISERYTLRDRFSKKLFDFVANNMRKEAIESGEEIIRLKFQGLQKYNVRDNEYYNLPEYAKGKNIKNIEKKNITKKEMCEKLGWNPNTPIVAIFSSDLTDGVFVSWSLFRDRLLWLRETLLKIKKINSVNWLIKPHPNDEINKVVTSTTSEYEKSCSSYNHIKLFPNDIAKNSIPKIIDTIISGAGSVVNLEYPCFGIPVISCAEMQNTGFGYTIDIKSKREYFLYLENIIKLEKLKNREIELAKIYIFILMKLAIVPTNLLVDNDTREINEKKYWTDMMQLLNRERQDEDLLIKMMKIQVENNDMHTVDYRMIKKIDSKKELNILSEGLNP